MTEYYAYTRTGERVQFSALFTSEAIDRCHRNGWSFGGVVQNNTGFRPSRVH